MIATQSRSPTTVSALLDLTTIPYNTRRSQSSWLYGWMTNSLNSRAAPPIPLRAPGYRILGVIIVVGLAFGRSEFSE